MHMPLVVSSGSSTRILYPRESFNSEVDPDVLIITVYQSTMWYLR
jgi:hypothetical protein